MIMQKLSASLVVCLVLFALSGTASAQKKEPQALFMFRENNLMGFIDKTGKVVIPAQFASVDTFSDGLALVSSPTEGRGYIDQTGRMVLRPPSTYGSKSFSEGLAAFATQNPNGTAKWGYLDKTGKVVIEPQFEEASDFSDGMARVKEYGKFTFIDKTGKIIADPVFDNAIDFSGGLARVFIGTRWGYIDKTGRYVWRSK
jgi:hypothetical protein